MMRRSDFEALLRHSRLLRASMNLAHERHQHLEQTLHGLGFSTVPRDQEAFTAMQVQAAKEIGGVEARMFLDAPQEIMKYHFGPLQVSLCLLYAMIERYRQLAQSNPTLHDESLDHFCHDNREFVESLEALRDSLLHQRHDNIDTQSSFVEAFTSGDHRGIVPLLIEGASIYEQYFKRLHPFIREINRL